MSFEPITHIKLSKAGTPLSKSSIRVYTKKLDLLASSGYDTIESLVENAQSVIDYLDLIYESDSDQVKKDFYSAIFFALYKRPLSDQKPYYDAFQKFKVPYNAYLAAKQKKNVESE